MDESAIRIENERLKASWDCFSSEHLAVYLAIEEQDQRINAHSILTRALLIDTLWPGRFDSLITEEMRFGVVMTWLLEQLQRGSDRCALLDRVLNCASGAADAGIPEVVRETAAWLQTDACPIPDYVSEALMFVNADRPESLLAELALDTFYEIWKAQLSGLTAERIRVLEVACGSGNDYRGLRDSGVGAFLDYSGFDIASKNVANARREFPRVNFFEASLLDSGLPDGAADYVFAHDIIGHLSREGMERAVSEILRIARREAWIHCYNALEIEDHQIRPFKLYFKNRISIPRLSASFRAAGASVRVVPISAMLQRKFNFVQDYTVTSVTFIATKQGA